MEMGRMQGMDRGLNILIPILITEVTSLNMERMPTCLKWLIRRKTYIEWSDDPAEREEFWRRVQIALFDPGEETWVCECGKAVFDRLNEPNQTETAIDDNQL